MFKEDRGLQPHEEERNVFIAMRRFPSSQFLSQGLDYVHGKDALPHNVLVPRPTFPHLKKKNDSNSFKVLKHCFRIGEDDPQISGWFQKAAWGRMQEAGVVSFGFAELIYRCMYDAPWNTHEELAKLLSSIKFGKGDPWISFVDCSVPPLPKGIPRKYAEEKKSDYGARIRPLLSGMVKACNAAIVSAGTAFRNSIPSFGFACSPKKLGLKQNKQDRNVPLCKLEVIPPNALDFLWERIVGDLKERAGEGFVRDESFHVIESELNRVFKMTNTVFKYTRDTHLRKRFEDSSSRKRTMKVIEKYTENLEHIRNFNLRKLRRLARFPSTSRLNYIDGRYTRNDSFTQDAAALSLFLSQKSTPRQDVSEERSQLFPIMDGMICRRFSGIPMTPNPRTHWSLVALLSMILPQVSGHAEGDNCYRGGSSCMSDAYRREKLQACVSILRRTREHVYEKNKAEHGEQSLRSQAVFARHDDLASAALQMADENSFRCLPFLHLYLERNTTLEEFEVQANVVRGEITNAQDTEMMLNRERRKHQERGKRREMVARIDFAGLEYNKLRQPSLLKFSVDFRIIGEERGSQNKEHIHSFQMGNEVWVSSAVRGRSKRKGEQFESRPKYLGFVMSPSKIIDDASSTPLRRMELGIMSVEPDCAERDYKELWTNLRRLLDGVCKKSTDAGSAHMRILASGINILTQMNVFRFSVSQDVPLPMSFNLATLHPRLLQQNVHRLCIISPFDLTRVCRDLSSAIPPD